MYVQTSRSDGQQLVWIRHWNNLDGRCRLHWQRDVSSQLSSQWLGRAQLRSRWRRVYCVRKHFDNHNHNNNDNDSDTTFRQQSYYFPLSTLFPSWFWRLLLCQPIWRRGEKIRTMMTEMMMMMTGEVCSQWRLFCWLENSRSILSTATWNWHAYVYHRCQCCTG